MDKGAFENSYISKLLFYSVILIMPAILMTIVAVAAPDSPLSPQSPDPSRFLFFIIYFLPGLIMARSITKSWRKTIGVAFAYIIISPAYYTYAVDYACRISDSCVSV